MKQLTSPPPSQKNVLFKSVVNVYSRKVLKVIWLKVSKYVELEYIAAVSSRGSVGWLMSACFSYFKLTVGILKINISYNQNNLFQQVLIPSLQFPVR